MSSFLRDDGTFQPVSGAGSAGIDWVNISASPYNASTSANDNSAAIAAAVSAAVAANVPLYIPAGVWKYSTGISITNSVIPIIGDGKNASVLLYTGSGAAITYNINSLVQDARVTQNAAYSNMDGALLRDFQVAPSVGGGGTYGIHINTTAVAGYNYFLWENVRVGQFGTYSVYMDNSSGVVNAQASGRFQSCDFINSINCAQVGDSFTFQDCRIDGTAVATFSQFNGLPDNLQFIQCNITTAGGVYFNGCGDNLLILNSEQEIFVSSGYTGPHTAHMLFNNCSSVSIENSLIGLVDSGSKATNGLQFTGCGYVRYRGSIICQGSINHIADSGTMSGGVFNGTCTIDDAGDNGFQGGAEVSSHTQSGTNTYIKRIPEHVTAIGDANYTVLSTDRTVYQDLTMTAGRTWFLPKLSTVPEGAIFRFIDYAGQFATHNVTLSAFSGDVISPGSVATKALTVANSTTILIASTRNGFWWLSTI